MKKSIIMLAMILVAASTTAQAADGKKKSKKAKTDEPALVATPVSLATESDSISYAAGEAYTQGFMEYLVKNMQVDTAYLADFEAGYREYMKNSSDPKFAAYTAGSQIAQQVGTQFVGRTEKQFGNTDVKINANLMHEGFLAGVLSDTTLMKTSAATKYVEGKQKAKKDIRDNTTKAAGEAFLAENKTKEGVVVTASGLQYKVLTQGNGAVPTADDKVKVRYEGRLLDGTVFDSSYKRNPNTASFKVSSLIKGWVEALQLMPVGSKWELYIPYDLAYGQREAGSIPPYSTLIFTMELVEIEKADAAKK